MRFKLSVDYETNLPSKKNHLGRGQEAASLQVYQSHLGLFQRINAAIVTTVELSRSGAAWHDRDSGRP